MNHRSNVERTLKIVSKPEPLLYSGISLTETCLLVRRYPTNRWRDPNSCFNPAVSRTAKKKMNQAMRNWKIHLKSDKSLEELAEKVNSIIQGWINYYAQFYKSALYPILKHFDKILTKWARRNYKKLKESKRKAIQWLERINKLQPNMFAHWKFLSNSMAG